MRLFTPILLLCVVPASATSIQIKWDVSAFGGQFVGQTSAGSGSLTNTVTSSGIGCGGANSFATETVAASFGALAASGSGNATNSGCNGAFAYSGTTDSGQTPESIFVDFLHFNSSILGPGDPVQYEITETFSASIAFQGGAGGAGDKFLYDRLSTDAGTLNLGPGTYTYAMTGHIGSPAYLSDGILAQNYADENFLGAPQTAAYNFSGNSTTCVDVLTPGVSMTSESGTTYCSSFESVPEPGTLLMFGAGLVVARRRKIDP